MQLVLEKKNTLEMNEFTENEISKTKSRIEISTILENLRKPLILKCRGTHIDFDFESRGFLCLRTGAAHKMYNRFAIRGMSVFRVKFNVEFTRQAGNFSII